MSAPRRLRSAPDPPVPKFGVSRRGLAFCAVGAMGIAVQLGVLYALTHAAGMHYLLATAPAVEAAVLHNFLWHERWTWCDRMVRDKSARWTRLWRFNAANGGISMMGNLVVMQILVGTAKVPQLLANAIAIAVCSVLNFVASDRWVFTRLPRVPLGNWVDFNSESWRETAGSSRQRGRSAGIGFKRIRSGQLASQLRAERRDRFGPSTENRREDQQAEQRVLFKRGDSITGAESAAEWPGAGPPTCRPSRRRTTGSSRLFPARCGVHVGSWFPPCA